MPLKNMSDLYGDGSDGSVEVNAMSPRATRNMQYENVSASTLEDLVRHGNGFHVLVRGTLTIRSGGLRWRR